MDAFMGGCLLITLFGAIVMVLGMGWTLLDGRLWNNPGEALAHVGMGIMGLSSFVMLVALFIAGLQCAISPICQL